jgi:hypothetical protein
MERLYTIMYNTKQYHTRRLKPLKPTLNPTVYQFVVWTTNQKWKYTVKYTQEDRLRVESHWYYKLWK